MSTTLTDNGRAPSALPATRAAGVCLPITALPGRYGIGELGDQAHAFVDTLVSMGLSVWQFLPPGPTAYGDSPYQPLSTFAGNELLIDTATLIRAGLLSSIEADKLLRFADDRVDYGRLIPLKRELLARAASRFRTRANDGLRAEFASFLERHDQAWLHNYALYRVLKTAHDEQPWYAWPNDYAEREPSALRAVERERAHDIAAIKVQQFFFDCQWQNLRRYAAYRGVSMFGDLPIYIAHDSADVWATRDIVRLDASGRPTHVAGVPPDYFSEDGQLWGNPLYDWTRHADDGYRWWIARMQRALELADLIRVDHFRGFEAYWAVPADASTAREGEWLPGPGDSIFDALREALGHLPIVAEDLGVITPAVTALRERHGLPGMTVLQFAICDESFAIEHIPVQGVCYTGTHDNDTTCGWFHGAPDDARSEDERRWTRERVLAVTGGSDENIHTALIRMAFSSPALLAIAPMQDFLGLGSEARLNLPGTATDNWRWRLKPEQLSATEVAAIAALVGDRAPKRS